MEQLQKRNDYLMDNVETSDTELEKYLEMEKRRQENTINLIASENYASKAVLDAQGSWLTNKYAEGYPGHRYYGGCEAVDEIEKLAIQRSMKLFRAGHSNVQPHSGSQANFAAYISLLSPHDRVLSMSLSHGGHLTHGSTVNFSGVFYSFSYYGVDRKTEQLDYDEIEKLAREFKPKLIVAGASAYARTIDFKNFRQIADKVGAKLMVDMAHIAGMVATGLHPSPVPYADIVTSTTHKTLRGARGGFILCPEERASSVDAAVFPGLQGGPLENIIAAKAVTFYEALQPDFLKYQKAVLANSKTMAGELQRSGLRLVSGGTDNHMALLDLTPLGITGRVAEKALELVGIIVNRNSIPFDSHPPQITSGIRIGTPAVTTRGMDTEDVKRLAQLIHQVLTNLGDEPIKRKIRREVEEFCIRYPIPSFLE